MRIIITQQILSKRILNCGISSNHSRKIKYLYCEYSFTAKNYAFIPVNIAYDEKSPDIKNHWIAIIIDKENQLIFYLDPAQKNEVPEHILDFKNTLNYKREIITNPINPQEKEKDEGLCHCSAYMVEIFNIFGKNIQNGEHIIGAKLADISISSDSISLLTALSEIHFGEVEDISAIRIKQMIDACNILGVNLNGYATYVL